MADRDWNPTLHPRAPRGFSNGGEFIEKGSPITFVPAKKDRYLLSGFQSSHVGTNGRSGDFKYNENNAGVGVMIDGFAVGTYKNSINKQSVYAAKELRTQIAGDKQLGVDVGVLMGGVTGYKKELQPVVIPEVIAKMGDVEAAFVYVPPIKGLTPAVVAAQLRVKF